MNSFTEKVSSPAGMGKVARKFLTIINEKEANGKAFVAGLSGDLGAGKTTFVQAVAKTLGITETVTSPTFVIEKIYEIPKSAKSRFKHLIHIDAYRLESPDELAKLGFMEITAEQTNLILIEWPERVASLLVSENMRVNFTHNDEKTRTLEFCYS